MLMTCGLFLGLAVFLRMDMLMCLFITLALHTFWRMYANGGGSRTDRVLFPLFVFLGLFTKGPAGLLVPLLSTVVFLAVRRQLRSVGRYWGWRTWGILAAGCALWFTMVRIEGGAAYLDNLLFHQTLDRAVDAFHHKEPVWYYLVSTWWSLAPWSLLIAGIFGLAIARRMKPTALEQFFLTIILSTLAMLSAFSSKIAVYLAPTFPFFVYLAALFAARMPVAGWMKALAAIPALVWTAIPAALPFVLRRPDCAFLANGWCLAAAILLGAAGLGALLLLPRSRTLRAPIGLLASGVLLAACIGGFALPQLNAEIGYGPLCREAQRIASGNGLSSFYTWNMRRPEAMDVYLGEDIVPTTTESLLAGRHTDGVLLLPQRKLHDDPALQDFVAARRHHEAGKYLIVELPETQTP